ncbi:MAG: hypothetical protein ACUVT2_06675 [Thiobacillaceae bacterium]
MSKRLSGPPRRPLNPVARAVRTPQYRQRVERDKKRHPPPGRAAIEAELKAGAEAEGEEKEPDPGSQAGV